VKVVKVAFLAGFSYPVEVEYRIRFRNLSERAQIHWFSISATDELEEAISEALRSDALVLFLAAREVVTLIPSALERWTDDHGPRFTFREFHQDSANQVRRNLVGFFGADALEPPISDSSLRQTLDKGRVLCVNERRHARGFRTTLRHAGLLGRGVEFVERQYTFSEMDDEATGELVACAPEFDRMLFASSGLGTLHPRILRKFMGRIDSGPQALDAVEMLVRLLGAEEEQRELAAAKAVQMALLPQILPERTGFDLAAFLRPTRLLAGDFYDALAFDDGATGIVIADVAGKGHPAAMLAGNVLGALRAYASQRLRPGVILAAINGDLCNHSTPARPVTAFYGEFEPVNGHFVYANAGHNPPVVVRANGAVEYLESGGILLGAFANQSYAEGMLILNSGDRLLLFTDGIVEAFSPTGEEFGNDRLIRVLKDSPGVGARRLIEIIVTSVEEHCGGEFQDDATLMAIIAKP
jgi:serine phosphatase RsbU (regulator of sigma subunit)